MHGIWRLTFQSYITFVTVPGVILAFILYYHFGNPELDFLPGDASLSWWCLFLARQAVMAELSILIEHILVDGVALRTRWAVNLLGPLVTLLAIQADGWPFISTCETCFIE